MPSFDQIRFNLIEQIEFVEKQNQEHKKILIGIQQKLNDEPHCNINCWLHPYTLEFYVACCGASLVRITRILDGTDIIEFSKTTQESVR